MSSINGQSAADDRVPDGLPEIEAPPPEDRVRARHAGRLRPGQFRLAHLFWLTAMVAVVCSLTATLGAEFLGAVTVLLLWFILLVAYLYAPCVVVLVAWWYPWIRRENRKWLGSGVAGVILLPFALGPLAGGPVGPALACLAVLSLCWLPQVALLKLLASPRNVRTIELPDKIDFPRE